MHVKPAAGSNIFAAMTIQATSIFEWAGKRLRSIKWRAGSPTTGELIPVAIIQKTVGTSVYTAITINDLDAIISRDTSEVR